MIRKLFFLFLILIFFGFSLEHSNPQEKKPLSIEDIEDLLRNFVSKKRIVDLIKDYGVEFEKTEENIEKLKKIGADESIFAAVEKEWDKNNRILTIETDPIGATVYLDGIKRGQTPLKLEGLKPREYTLRIEKEGYFDQERTVSLTESIGKRIEANLKKKDLTPHEFKPKIEIPRPKEIPKLEHVKIHLNYSIFFPAPHKHTVLATEWAREIEKKTNGIVKISMFPGGTLTSADKCYDGVVKGISDIGMSVFAYNKRDFPLTEVIDLPLGYKSGWAATKLINEYFKRFKPKELDAVKVMYLHAHGPGILHTRRAVNKLEDLRGMKIRAAGITAKIVAALGGTPVAMPIGDTYEALRRGVVDGFMAPQEALYGWKLGEVAKYTVETFGSGYSTGFYVVMNKDKWNALSSDTQKIIEEVNEEWIEKTGRLWDEIDKVGRDFTLKLDNRIISLSNEENERWAKAVRPILDEYVHSMKTKGLPGDEALKFCLNHLKQIPIVLPKWKSVDKTPSTFSEKVYEKTVRLSIATGGTGGIYYPLGGGMANILSKYIPYLEATAEVTTASVDNCLLVGAGKADLALIMADVGWDAFQGKGKFKAKVPLRTAAVLYPNNMHIITLEGKGIEKVTDLKGKRVSTGAPGSGTEVKALRVIEAYGLDPDKDMTRDKLGASESAGALKDRKIDAYFWDGGLPTASVTDLGATPGIKMKLIGHEDAIPKMRGKYGPLYVKGIIPAKTYPGQEVDVPIAVVWNLLVCHENMKGDIAYDIVKTLFDHKPELVTVHREARFLSLEPQIGGSPFSIHPGAIRYFTEKGLKIK